MVNHRSWTELGSNTNIQTSSSTITAYHQLSPHNEQLATLTKRSVRGRNRYWQGPNCEWVLGPTASNYKKVSYRKQTRYSRRLHPQTESCDVIGSSTRDLDLCSSGLPEDVLLPN
ncbi:hypothetical protein BaRGS_00003203 [Batillaria attramentaria]|uniref:Uncharacterized protein n=1 Tax=Batillaria attramentaria TaxID=370345 RepID=A0ABD0M2C9_9CAEN